MGLLPGCGTTSGVSTSHNNHQPGADTGSAGMPAGLQCMQQAGTPQSARNHHLCTSSCTGLAHQGATCPAAVHLLRGGRLRTHIHRRCGAAGFLLPLSGGADSSSTAAIVGAMCQVSRWTVAVMSSSYAWAMWVCKAKHTQQESDTSLLSDTQCINTLTGCCCCCTQMVARAVAEGDEQVGLNVGSVTTM
jgi:hypothetical protein